MRPWWGPFLNWLNSPQGWIFYALLSAFIVSILSNLVAYARRLRERGVERMGLGRLLAIMGGVVTLIALTILPWESYTSLSCPDCGGFWPGLALEPSLLAIAVLVVGLLWFTFFGLGKKLAATLGFGGEAWPFSSPFSRWCTSLSMWQHPTHLACTTSSTASTQQSPGPSS